MATARKTTTITAQTAEYVKVGETKGTFKFQPADEEGAVTGTLYMRKNSAAHELGQTVERLTVTIEPA